MGRLAALEVAPGTIELLELATSRVVGRLEDPFGDRSTWIGFTPAGTELAVASAYSNAIHIWNLRAISQRLRALGCESDAVALVSPTSSPPRLSRFVTPAIKLQVVGTGAPSKD